MLSATSNFFTSTQEIKYYYEYIKTEKTFYIKNIVEFKKIKNRKEFTKYFSFGEIGDAVVAVTPSQKVECQGIIYRGNREDITKVLIGFDLITFNKPRALYNFLNDSKNKGKTFSGNYKEFLNYIIFHY